MPPRQVGCKGHLITAFRFKVSLAKQGIAVSLSIENLITFLCKKLLGMIDTCSRLGLAVGVIFRDVELPWH